MGVFVLVGTKWTQWGMGHILLHPFSTIAMALERKAYKKYVTDIQSISAAL